LALQGIDLQLESGKCLGLVGPNGAGKTTLLKILSTLTVPSSGTVTIAGLDASRAAERIRPLLGVLSHRTFLYGHLTAFENLHFYGRMLGVIQLGERIREVLETVGLATLGRQLVRTYSRGMQQRLAIARAVLHRPRLLLLDEPYNALDAQAVARVQELLRQLSGEGHTVVISTHDLPRGFELCDEIAIQRRGRIVDQITTSQNTLSTFSQLYSRHVG
jgi:heme exporter protein A